MSQKNNEELFIFRRMAEGDKAAFRFFFDKYYSDLCNFVHVYVHDQAISEQIVQDIFVYLWEKKDKIGIGTSLRSYLLRAAKNKSLNYLRNEKTRLGIQENLAHSQAHNHETPEYIFNAGQLRGVIEESVDRLPPKCRQVYILGKEKDLSYKEIARKLNISVKTVENHMGKALKQLRENLQPYYNDIFLTFLLLNLSGELFF